MILHVRVSLNAWVCLCVCDCVCLITCVCAKQCLSKCHHMNVHVLAQCALVWVLCACSVALAFVSKRRCVNVGLYKCAKAASLTSGACDPRCEDVMLRNCWSLRSRSIKLVCFNHVLCTRINLRHCATMQLNGCNTVRRSTYKQCVCWGGHLRAWTYGCVSTRMQNNQERNHQCFAATNVGYLAQTHNANI